MTDFFKQQPLSREALLLTLLEQFGYPDNRAYAHELLDMIFALPISRDPLLRELHLVRTAFGLMDHGACLATSSPLCTDLSTLITEVIIALETANLESVSRVTERVGHALNVLEASITGTLNSLPENERNLPGMRELVINFRKRLYTVEVSGGDMVPIPADSVGKPLFGTDISFDPTKTF